MERPQPQPTTIGAEDRTADGHVFDVEQYWPPTFSYSEKANQTPEANVRLGNSSRSVGQQVLRSSDTPRKE